MEMKISGQLRITLVSSTSVRITFEFKSTRKIDNKSQDENEHQDDHGNLDVSNQTSEDNQLDASADTQSNEFASSFDAQTGAENGVHAYDGETETAQVCICIHHFRCSLGLDSKALLQQFHHQFLFHCTTTSL